MNEEGVLAADGCGWTQIKEEGQKRYVMSKDGRTTVRGMRVGVVASARRDKTVKVVVAYRARHAKYGKYVRRRTILQVHDEKNEAQVGDRVAVVPCRPISKTKRWRLIRVVTSSAGGAGESGQQAE